MEVDADAVSKYVTKSLQKKVLVCSLADALSKVNCFMLGFECVEDRYRALEQGPWSFKGYTFALKAWSPCFEGSALMDSLRLWVQIHNLPHEYFSVANGIRLGGMIRKVIHVELEEDKPMSQNLYLRVLVDINIEKLGGCDDYDWKLISSWAIDGSCIRLCWDVRVSFGLRQLLTGTNRPQIGKDQAMLKIWVPKKRLGEEIQEITRLGNKGKENLNIEEKAPEFVPSLELLKMDNSRSDSLVNMDTENGNIKSKCLGEREGPTQKINNMASSDNYGLAKGMSMGPVCVVEAEPINGEDRALSLFFKAQEQLLYDLKHFGNMDLFEIKETGGDIGVLPTSETNQRTTPFKKRKFNGFSFVVLKTS
ncbi:hypothetical protein G4B88_024762 [Cannabis sativa]|uniref:DUF4283 domain-containing protein n=1 Tax=Cannabis sativa TaxID=3483 RepID=A0A7J6DT19_CANSA|nr:hypothetical protein G4B88_024762 [Cannabis sativa]